MAAPALDRFLSLVRDAVSNGTLVKLTLAKYRGADRSLRNVFIRPVQLKSGPHLSFVWRYESRDVTKNHSPADALSRITELLGGDFWDAHLFTSDSSAQLEMTANSSRLRSKSGSAGSAGAPPQSHDRSKSHLISADAAWLRALGVTNEHGRPREGMSDKFRQIQKFAEIISHLVEESFPCAAQISPVSANGIGADRAPLQIVDMGAGKGYLTFAVAALLRERARVVGVEARPELVELCNRVVQEHNLGDFLQFVAGTIASTELQSLDILIALHACDTATDDALAKGIAAGATLLVVSPCCQKELRPQLVPPPVLERALQHGIFQERQAEFVTDSLRAQLLEWAGYRTRVFEFISTEHTAKNTMITAVKSSDQRQEPLAPLIREFAAFYGIKSQRLARHLGFDLAGEVSGTTPNPG